MIPMNATLKLVIALVLVGAVGALKSLGVVEPGWSWVGTLVQLLTVAEVFFTVPPSASAKLKAAAAGAATKVLFLLVALFALLCSGCLSSAPVVPVTPANQAQVTTCENAATLHNGFVIGDFTFTAVGGGAGAAAALVSDPQAKTDLGIVGAIAGAGALAATSIVGLSASDFNSNQCTNVVGPLPSAQPGAGQ